MPDDFDKASEEYRRQEFLYDQAIMGLDCWEYAWVRPEGLDDYGADRWRIVCPVSWHESKVLMERKRLTDDDSLREITG